jgi:hypothetical protein
MGFSVKTQNSNTGTGAAVNYVPQAINLKQKKL